MKRIFILFFVLTCNFSAIAQERAFNIEMEMVDMYVNNYFDTVSVCNNCKAIKVFEQYISVVQSCIDENDFFNSKFEIMPIMLNLELLTNIESESDADFSGKYKPTNKDVEKWTEWFKEHKDHICWYERKNILFLRK